MIILAVQCVDDFAAATAWYERFFGRPPDTRPMDGLAEWIAGSGGIAVFRQAETAGSGFVTIVVGSIDAQRAELAGRGLDLGPRQPGGEAGIAQIRDPAGNTITFAERKGDGP